MTERDNPKEETQIFPKIPKKTVDDFIKNVWEKPDTIRKQEIIKELKESDPQLQQIIEELCLAYPEDPEGVRVGAYLMYEVLNNINPRLSNVSTDIVDTFRQEYMSFPAILELTNPILDPYHYAEENPSLMVWVAGLPDESMRMGCMLVYEIKRRQHHSNKLSEEFKI